MKTVTRGLFAASVLVGSVQFTAAQSADDILPTKSVSMAEAPQVEERAERGRSPFDDRHVVPLIVMSMFIGPALIAAVLAMWFQHRSRVKALDVLRVYAERNEEPPASVTQALTGVAPPAAQAPLKPPPTRGQHLAHVAANVVFTLGAIGIVWWKAPDPSNPGGFVIFAILAGLFFAAGAAARLVGAIYARE